MPVLRALPLLLLLAAPLAAAQTEAPVEAMIHVGRAGDAFAYAPARLEVAPGAPVQLMIFGNESHSVTSDSGAWPEALAPGTGDISIAEFRAPLEPGEYPFHCRLHHDPATGAGPAGVLVVKAAEGETAAREAPFPASLAVAALAGCALLARRRMA